MKFYICMAYSFMLKIYYFIRLALPLFSRALSVLFAPPFCAYCGIFLSEATVFCSTCFSAITPVASYAVSLTARNKMTVYAVGLYNEPLKSLVQAKLNGTISAARQLGELMSQTPACTVNDFDYLVPIPLHWRRFAWRGFNQAQEIADVLSRKSGVPVVSALKRVKNTKFQSLLHRTERAGNVREAFTIKDAYKQMLAGKKILLIDDLFTTGATLYAAGRVLHSCKPEVISGFVACRVT